MFGLRGMLRARSLASIATKSIRQVPFGVRNAHHGTLGVRNTPRMAL